MAGENLFFTKSRHGFPCNENFNFHGVSFSSSLIGMT